MANLRGHVALHNEGWKVIPSTKKSLNYCYQKSIVTSKDAWRELAHNIKTDSVEFKESMKKNPGEAKDLLKKIHKMGTQHRKRVHKATKNTVKFEWRYGKESFKKAWDKLLLGTIHLSKRTKDDWWELKNIPGNFFKEVDQDFKKVKVIIKKLRGEKSKEIDVSWSESIKKASEEWNKEYKRSGTKRNSLEALPSIMWGHVKAFYYGVLKPTVKSIYKGGKKTVKVVGKVTRRLTIYPAGGAIIISGRAIYSLGKVFFYSGKIGIKFLSPTVEAGLLSGMGMLSMAAIAPTYTTGVSLGVFDQVAMSAVVAPSASAGKMMIDTSVYSGKYVGLMFYDLTKTAGKVTTGVFKSGVVLGYNAMTVIPVHMTMGVFDSAIFLAWDGPRLVIAYAKGEIDGNSINDLPVGSVVDLKKLKEKNIQVEVLSDDPKVIKKVLKKIPEDLRE